MSEKNEGAGKLSPERYRMESLPGFDAVPRDMQDALERFNDDAQEIVHSFLATLALQQPPPIIYHYTNDVGLKGILETGQLWLTDIFSLNDPSELTHGLPTIRLESRLSLPTRQFQARRGFECRDDAGPCE
jgi:hypothetical protein